MKKLILVLVLIMILVLTPSAAIAQESNQKRQIQQLMKESLREYKIPGASLAIVKEGKIIFQENWGVQSDGMEITNQTLFTIGSISKPITSLAIMKLVQEGQINLDHSILTYLPSFKYDKKNFKNGITVRQLLSHTSGISSYDGLRVADLQLRGKGSIKKATDMLNGVELNNEPGRIHQYSAANYILLGSIIEEVSKTSFAKFMENEIFTEIGMDRTAANYKEALKLGYKPGYQAWFGTPVKSDNYFDDSGVPYGYIASTSSDMIKFIEFILGKQKVLNQENFMEYISPQVHRKESLYYGLGWRISTEENNSYLFHGGETPDSRAELFIHPSKKYGFILLTNKNNVSDVMHTTYIKEGIRNIIERKNTSEIIPSDYRMQWITFISILTVLFFSLWLVYRLKKQKIIILRNRVVGSIYLVVALSIIPTCVVVFDSPWRTISLYGSDIAMLANGLIAICIGVSCILFIQNFSLRSNKTTKEIRKTILK